MKEYGIDLRLSHSYCVYMLKFIGTGCFVALTLLYASCGDSIERFYLLSDRTELAIAVEMYEKTHSNIKVSFQHKGEIDANTVNTEQADLIIAEDINSEAMIKLLAPLDNPGSEYPALNGPKDSKGRTVLIPLSFKLPLIMARKEVMDETTDGVLIRRQDIQQEHGNFIRRDNSGRLSRLDFSPGWNPLFFFDLLTLESIETQALSLTNADNNIFNEITNKLMSWIEDSASAIDDDQFFNAKYRYIPDANLLKDKRILFARTDFQTWNNLPAELMKIMDFRYFAGERKIPVSSVTWAAINKDSSNSRIAEDFINWLILPETQQMLMEAWEKEGLSIFGFLNGLSTVEIVNELILIGRDASIRGRIPEDHYLTMNRILPDRWSRIRDEVIIPWFYNTLYNADYSENLSDAYARWDLSSLEVSKY